jgi:multicomponent Na+:H+ antiporter subunit D
VALLSAPIIVTWVLATVLALLDGRRLVVGWISVAGMVVSLAATVALAVGVMREGKIEMVAGGWPDGVGIALRADALGVTFALVSGAVILIALLYEVLGGVRSRTFPALVLFLNSGLMGIFLTRDIFNFYVFFEIAMTASYVLTGYRERDYQVRAAFIFAVVNLLGSVIFVIAVAGLYHLTGSLDMDMVGARIGEAGPAPTIAIAAAVFVAFGLKLGLFPFHFWLPAVYVGSHAPVAAILSGALANIGSYGLLRFGGDIMPEQLAEARVVLLVIGTLSIIYGALQAISRRSPVEVMAYSSIGQVGYILVALGIGGALGFAAATLYAVVNSLNKLLLFLATGLRGPLVGAAFAIGAFSVAGVPPAAGFLGKLSLFRAGLGVDSLAGSVILVALVFVGGTLSFLYSFQVYQRVYMRPGGAPARRPGEASPAVERGGKPSPAVVRGLVIVVAGLVVAIGLWPEPLLVLSQGAAEALAGAGAPTGVSFR